MLVLVPSWGAAMEWVPQPADPGLIAWCPAVLRGASHRSRLGWSLEVSAYPLKMPAGRPPEVDHYHDLAAADTGVKYHVARIVFDLAPVPAASDRLLFPPTQTPV